MEHGSNNHSAAVNVHTPWDGIGTVAFSASIGMPPQRLAKLARSEAATLCPQRQRNGLDLWLDPSRSLGLDEP